MTYFSMCVCVGGLFQCVSTCNVFQCVRACGVDYCSACVCPCISVIWRIPIYVRVAGRVSK